MVGFGAVITDASARLKSDAQIVDYLGNIESTIAKCVDLMPGHAQFVERYCPAGTPA